MKRILILLSFVLLFCVGGTFSAYALTDEEGWPVWAHLSSENDGRYIIDDETETGPTEEKLIELCKYFYPYDGYYSTYIDSIGYMYLNFFVPDDTTRNLINQGYELVILPVDSYNGNCFYFDYCLLKGSDIKDVSGDSYQVCNNIDLNNYVVHKVSNCRLIYSPKYSYSASVRMYLIEDHSSYKTVAEARQAILNGEISADNESDFLPAQYGVLEVPQNFQFHYDGDGGSYEKNSMLNEVSFTWSQTDENASKWTTEFLFYGTLRYRGALSWLSKWKTTDLYMFYEGSTATRLCKYKVAHLLTAAVENELFLQYIYDDIDSTSPQLNGFGDLSVFVRNKYSDGEYTYYSNWLQCDLVGSVDADGVPMIDTSNSSSDEREGQLEDTVVEIEYDDAINGDSGQDFSKNPPSGQVNADSVYDGTPVPVVNDSDVGSLVSGITDGFGLSGEGGTFDFFSDLFSFIPSPIWTLILAGVSVLISIALLKAVF